ncbi:MAG: Fe-S cluster assembly protein SufD [Gemmatimonadaceae bacterium]|nr:Fe-S cluster assembly protein SufD [Gemmatimonadaceae bacterium]
MSAPLVTAEPTFVGAVRAKGAAAFAAAGFPTTKNEDWKYTSVAAIADGGFAPAAAPAAHGVTAAALEPFAFGSAVATVVFVNGRFDAALSSVAELPAGVSVRPMADALREMPTALEARLGQIAAEQPFTARNASLMQDGFVVHVAKDVTSEGPIHVLFVADHAAKGVELPVRNLIVADRHAKVTVIESFVGLTGAAYFTNAVTEIAIADGATVTHLKVQREGAGAYHVGHIEAKQARDSHLVSFSFAVGAKLARTNVYTALAGAGCGATLNGLYLGDGEQHIDHQTRIEHIEPNCYSRELYKGILDGASHGVFNGKVYVHPEAQKTDGKQENHTLLLNERANIDTKPQLEIFADDVKCTHGATVGRMDQTSLFYMKSRGVGAELAKQLLIYAFAADALETIEDAAVREGLEALVLKRYTGVA